MSSQTNLSQTKEIKTWDVSSIFRDVCKSWFKILLVAVSAAMLMYSAIAFLHKPMYTVSSTFAVTTTSGGKYAAYDTAQKFQTILENNVLHNKVAEAIGEESFDAEMTASVVNSTNLMVLKVTASSPEKAFRILDGVLDNYASVSDYVIPNIVLETIERPIISDEPSNQIPLNRYMIIAALCGAAIAIALAVFNSYNRDTVKNENEFNAKIDGDMLGLIYHEKKTKKDMSMLLSNPLLSFQYVESYRMMASRIKGRMDSRGAKVVMVTSVLENEGKSTVASNLALALSQEKKKVVILDCDFRKPALYKIFGFSDTSGSDLSRYILGEKQNLAGLIKKKKGETLHFSFSYQAMENSSEIISNGNLRALIDQLRDVMDYIILDTPPMGLVADGEELIKLSDTAVLVVRQDTVLSRDINDAIDVLNQEEEKVLGCVFSNVLPDFGSNLTKSKASGKSYGHYGRRARTDS